MFRWCSLQNKYINMGMLVSGRTLLKAAELHTNLPLSSLCGVGYEFRTLLGCLNWNLVKKNKQRCAKQPSKSFSCYFAQFCLYAASWYMCTYHFKSLKSGPDDLQATYKIIFTCESNMFRDTSERTLKQGNGNEFFVTPFLKCGQNRQNQ